MLGVVKGRQGNRLGWRAKANCTRYIVTRGQKKKKKCKKNNPRSIKYRISLHLPEVGVGKRKNIPTNAFGKSSEKKEESMRPVSPFPLPSLYSHMALIDKACLLKVFSIHSSDVSPPSNSLSGFFISYFFCFVYSAGLSPLSAVAAGASSFFSAAGAFESAAGSASEEVQRV